MNLFLRYEIASRELDANILTALVAASRGHRVVVCDWAMMMREILLRNKQPGFVHMNSITPSWRTEIFHSIFRSFGLKISSLDQEAGISRDSFESFADSRFGTTTVSTTDIIFCWGPADHEVLQSRFPKDRRKFVMTGSPRVDLWSPRFLRVYSDTERRPRPFILILSSLSGPLSSRSLQEDLRLHRESGYFERDPGLRQELVGKYMEGAELMVKYLDLLYFLSSAYEELEIVIKAHPSEDPETWSELLGSTKNIVVDRTSSTSALIRDCELAVTTGSTTAFEAILSGKPLVSFQPMKPKFRRFSFADRVGIVGRSHEEVREIIDGILLRVQGKDTSEQSGTCHDVLREKLQFEEDELAAERMVLAWESELANGQSIPQTDYRPSRAMTALQLRYYVASAFPFLTTIYGFFSTKSPRARRSSWKRPRLDRPSTLARIDEMKKALGLRESVSVRFKGRGGIVFENTG